MERRNTVQKVLVLHAVQNLHNHATADEVYEEVVREHPSVSRGTVYRNLKILAEEGSIQKVEVPDAADRFDHKTAPHYHILCERCGRVYDVDMDEIEDIFTRIHDTHGFSFTSYDISFKGICPSCRAE